MTTLSRTELSLPSHWYFDPEQFATELEAVWYRDWVCIGRQADIPRTGDYFVAAVGTQQLIVTRASDSQLHVFHNTCRHRGSQLCTEDRGRFRNGRIVCPYHTWTYSLAGELLATPSRLPVDDFCEADYALYSVNWACWGGYIFVCIADTPGCSLDEFLGSEAQLLKRWPLDAMISVQQDRTLLACNWKIFWENYSECYHCPRVHPELCKLVPLYRNAVFNFSDLPDWQPEGDGDTGDAQLAAGLVTWTPDGQTRLPLIPGLSAAELRNGVTFASFTASMFVVAHADYVRSVRVLPRGPESVELIVDWLLLPDVAESHAAEIPRMLEVGRLLVEQDGRVCEVNQRGLRSRRHRRGVLVPQEYSLWEFHQWLRGKLAADV